MINQRDWLQTRKNLLEQVKSQVQIRLGKPPASLRQYAKNLDRDFKGSWRPATPQDLERAIAKCKVLLSADFHAYAQSQRAHIRLLRDHVDSRSVVLALECVDHGKEDVVRRYLAGEVSEENLLDALNWRKAWGFPWEHYRPLFELARDRGWKIRGLGLGKTASLAKRDLWTAQRLQRFHAEDPARLVFAVMGEWHLASGHLPKRLRSKLKSAGDVLVVHQDVEQLYFRLASRNRETSVDVLKASGDRYCLMVSPPWMKWQSYLMYLEHAYDRDLQEDLAIDYTDHVASLIDLLASDLKINMKSNRIEVYCANSRTSLARLRLSLHKKQVKAMVYNLEHDQSFIVPQKGWAYLSRPTINHASALAGQYIHAQVSKRHSTAWNLPQDFLRLIWIEAIGFFFSKWINPKRKPETLENIRVRLAASHPKEGGRKALLLALDHRLSEVVWVQTGRLRSNRFKPREQEAFLDAARIVGSMLGERLFQKVRSRTISLSKLMSYLKVTVDGPNFQKFYWKLIREIEHDQSL